MNAKQKLHQQNLAMWNDCFQDQVQSGLSVKKWCILNNISIHAYNYWKHIAKEEYLNSILPDIVPLAAPSDPLPDYSLETIPTVMPTIATSVSRNSRNKLEMSFGDIHIEFGPSASDEHPQYYKGGALCIKMRIRILLPVLQRSSILLK